MKRSFFLLVLLASLLVPCASHAQVRFGQVAAVLPGAPNTKLLANPLRQEVYVPQLEFTTPTNGSLQVNVVETNTFTTTQTYFVGGVSKDSVSVISDMAVSFDGDRFFVAVNTTTTADGITAGTLYTFDRSGVVPESSELFGAPIPSLALGLNNRLYISLTVDAQSNLNTIYEYDVTVQQNPFSTSPEFVLNYLTNFNSVPGDNNFLRLGPDGGTLYVASATGADGSPGSLKSFDVSTPTPRVLTVNNSAGINPTQLISSHTGRYVGLPGPDGNPASSAFNTYLFSGADVSGRLATLNNGAFVGPLAFDLSDSLVYQAHYGTALSLQVFDARTSAKLQELNLGDAYSDDLQSRGLANLSLNAIVLDHTGTYLFIADSTSTVTVVTTGAVGDGTLTPPDVTPQIISPAAATATQGLPFTYQITTIGVTSSFDATGLPAGLSVDTASGLISGTPTTPGRYRVQLSANSFNSTSTGTQVLNLTVLTTPADLTPVITTTTLPDGITGQNYNFTVTATNAPFNFGATNLPPGLNIDSVTGVISGIPVQPGAYAVTLSATNRTGTGTATLTLTVTGDPIASPTITSPLAVTSQPGAAFTYQITATGNPTRFGAAGLPSGLSVDPASGLISGAPPFTGTFPITLSATNSAGTGTATLVLTITPPLPAFTSAATASGTVGVAFRFQVAATNVPTRFDASGLPSGLSINTSSGLIVGTPFVGGIFPVTLTAANSTGSVTSTLTLTIAALPIPVINSPAAATAFVGQPFGYQIAATNSPTNYSATGLPAGLSVDAATGLISGTPQAAGTPTIILTATNTSGVGTATLTLTINNSASNLPTLNIVATVPSVIASSGDSAEATITRTGDLSRKLVVFYRVSGTARAGTDYVALTGKAKFKPNSGTATIKITPARSSVDPAHAKLKISLLSNDTYQLGDVLKAKFKIVNAQ